jgi:hypothetical protein
MTTDPTPPRRHFLRAVATLGLAGTAGCSALFGPNSRSADPPSIVSDYRLKIVERNRPGDTDDPPRIDCTDGGIRVRGHVSQGGSDPIVVDSMSHDDGTFEAVVRVIDEHGADPLGKPVYEMNVSFSTLPDRIRVVENTSFTTVSETITC